MSNAKDALRRLIGRVAELAFPDLGREIDQARNIARAPKLKRAIRYARLRRAQSSGDVGAVENALAMFWKTDAGDYYHDRYADERLNFFQEHLSGLLNALVSFAENSDMRFSRLVEIGCGDGRALADCAGRLPWISEVIGLDINAAVITRALSKQPPGERLSFATADARGWLIENPQPGTVVLANNGVLEYFSPYSFDQLLQTLALSPPAAIVLIEPVAPNHDLENEAGSFMFGSENSFSHNHRRRLSAAGFHVVFGEEMRVSNVRLMRMIGVIK